MYYTEVPLQKEFDDLYKIYNETDYEFKFSDIPVITITIRITFENGAVQEKRCRLIMTMRIILQ